MQKGVTEKEVIREGQRYRWLEIVVWPSDAEVSVGG